MLILPYCTFQYFNWFKTYGLERTQIDRENHTVLQQYIVKWRFKMYMAENKCAIMPQFSFDFNKARLDL